MFVNPEEIKAKLEELVYGDELKVDIGIGINIVITDYRLYPCDYCQSFTDSICIFPDMIVKSFVDNYCKYLANTLKGIDISNHFTRKGLELLVDNAFVKYCDENDPIKRLCGNGYLGGYIYG